MIERLMAICWQRQGHGQSLDEAMKDLVKQGYDAVSVYLAWTGAELYGSELFPDEPTPSSTGPR